MEESTDIFDDTVESLQTITLRTGQYTQYSGDQMNISHSILVLLHIKRCNLNLVCFDFYHPSFDKN